MRLNKNFILLMVLFAAAGCATVGTKIDLEKVKQIEKGVTSKQEVIDLLGKPSMVRLTSDGKTIMMYRYVKATNKATNFIPVVNVLAGGMEMSQQIVQVLLDENDIVEKYIFNDSENEINSGLLNRD